MNETNLHRGFEAGNFANAYETDDLEIALENADHKLGQDYLDAFIMGFFSTYELHEIPSDNLDQYETAYWSRAGRACVRYGFIDPQCWHAYYLR